MNTAPNEESKIAETYLIKVVTKIFGIEICAT
jgi:hypothetical protein